MGTLRAITGFPQRLKVVLPYAFAGRTSPGVVTSDDHVFRINSIFDPDVSLGGHRPRGAAEWDNIYTLYRVWKVEGEIVTRQRAAHGIDCFLVANNVSTNLAGTAVLAEYPNAVRLGMTSSNTYPLKRKFCLYPHKVLGMTWQEYLSNEDTSALVTANPVGDCFMHFITNQVDAATVLDIETEITIYYHVVYFDPVDVPISA